MAQLSGHPYTPSTSPSPTSDPSRQSTDSLDSHGNGILRHKSISSTIPLIRSHITPPDSPLLNPSHPTTTGLPPTIQPQQSQQLTSSQIMQEERRRIHHEADVVVVGAGIFGCAISYALARQGRSVLLLERSMKEPDRIVGELLQPGGVSALEKLGLAHCLDEIDSIRVDGYKIIYHGEEVAISYPANAGQTVAKHGIQGEESTNEDSIRPKGRSFHHGRFIRRLREACAAESNITMVETTATSTISSTSPSSSTTTPQILGVNCLTYNPNTGLKETDYYFGALTIISDGYASLFRKTYHPLRPTVKSKFYALELIDCVLPLSNHGCVILSDDAPVLLYQIGTHETRALIDVPENTPSAHPSVGGIRSHLINTVYPTLPECVKPSFAKALDALGPTQIPRSMPNSFLPPTPQTTHPGLLLLGDAMNMRHPLTGGGMTVAFNDALLLSTLLAPARIPSLTNTTAINNAMHTFHWQRKELASIINILAQALYALFAAKDDQLRALQAGCFAYFQRGGECVDGPVGLLGGIIRRPMVLIWHFYRVAILAVYMVASSVLRGDEVIETADKKATMASSSPPSISPSTTTITRSKLIGKGDDSEGVGLLMFLTTFPLVLRSCFAVFWRACQVLFPYLWAEVGIWS